MLEEAIPPTYINIGSTCTAAQTILARSSRTSKILLTGPQLYRHTTLIPTLLIRQPLRSANNRSSPARVHGTQSMRTRNSDKTCTIPVRFEKTRRKPEMCETVGDTVEGLPRVEFGFPTSPEPEPLDRNVAFPYMNSTLMYYDATCLSVVGAGLLIWEVYP